MSTLATIGAAALDQARLRDRIEVLTRQVSTGRKGALHGDLGTEARRAIDLRGEIARREAAAAAADRALARSGTVGRVLDRLHALTAHVAGEALRARALGTAGVEAVAASARAALAEAGALLNTRQDGEYLFSGSDIANPPVPDGEAVGAGLMGAAIAAAVATLTPANAAAILASTQAVATAPATSPFSPFLEGPGLAEPRRAVQVADGERVGLGVFANREAGGEVASSWGRELLRGLATLAALTPAQSAQGAGYDALLAGAGAALSGAAAGLADEQGALGAAEQRVGAARTRHADALVVLRGQLGDAEEVDLAAATAALRAVQARLEASYEATALVARLSLAAVLR